MSRVYSDTVLPEDSGVSQDLNLGIVGDAVTVIAGATLKPNKIADAGGNNIITSDGSGNLTLNGAFAGSMSLISTSTPTDVGYVQITGMTSAYKCYRFTMTNMNVSTNGAEWMFALRQVGGGFSGDTKTSTAFSVGHAGADNWVGLTYRGSTGMVRSNTADPQHINFDQGSAVDETGFGDLYIFNPYNDTYVKQYFGTTTFYKENDEIQTAYYAGFIDSTTEIDAIQFAPSSGTMTGIIKMYAFAGS